MEITDEMKLATQVIVSVIKHSAMTVREAEILLKIIGKRTEMSAEKIREEFYNHLDSEVLNGLAFSLVINCKKTLEEMLDDGEGEISDDIKKFAWPLKQCPAGHQMKEIVQLRNFETRLDIVLADVLMDTFSDYERPGNLVELLAFRNSYYPQIEEDFVVIALDGLFFNDGDNNSCAPILIIKNGKINLQAFDSFEKVEKNYYFLVIK